jgi:hypothetical protein
MRPILQATPQEREIYVRFTKNAVMFSVICEGVANLL